MTKNATSAVLDRDGIEISDLWHAYRRGKVSVLEGINLSLGKGFFGLLGANGAGKSTLMRIVCTLLKPTKGSVEVGGYDVTKNVREVRQMLGYLPQQFGAWRSHRVEEVLDTLARLSGMHDKKIRRARIAEVLEEVGLADVSDRKVKKLSGGMVRRLGVAQALVHEPQIVIVDEPTVGLDPEERMRFRQLMTRMGRDRTILLSTHIVADLGSGCERIALLDDHTIAFDGSPQQLLQLALGKVFEVSVTHSQVEDVESKFEIVSRVDSGGTVRYRIVTDDPPPGSVEVSNPSLEEAYLAFMSARGHAAGAREGIESTEDVSELTGDAEK